MKTRNSLSFAALLLGAMLVSCEKKNNIVTPDQPKYGVDGVTPLPEAVDIGTVVNGKTVKWASFNLGASRDIDYGDYYAWGETSTKDNYYLDTYIFSSDGKLLTKYMSREGDTKYWDYTLKPEGPDGVEKLDPDDDVALVKLGGSWRMPTSDDFAALLALQGKEGYEWDGWAAITDKDGNPLKDARGKDIRGLRITRTATGATLFFPAAGYSNKTEKGSYSGMEGKYWSSIHFPTGTIMPGWSAEGFTFHMMGAKWMAEYRYYGFSIRPVCD